MCWWEWVRFLCASYFGLFLKLLMMAGILLVLQGPLIILAVSAALGEFCQVLKKIIVMWESEIGGDLPGRQSLAMKFNYGRIQCFFFGN